jgi:hypothetical protein
MTATLLERTPLTRRTGANFIAEAGEAAEAARARAEVARLLARRSELAPANPASPGSLGELWREAAAYERDARRHDQAIAAVRQLLTDLGR